MLLVALMSVFGRPDVGGMLGCVNMFVMIGMGVYCLVTAKKPENRSRIRSGKFSLSASLAQKLMARKARADEKARHKKGPRLRAAGDVRFADLCRRGAGQRMALVQQQPVCDSRRGRNVSDDRRGGYELTAANGEKKPIKDLLKE